ncbi:YfiR family protein [Methylomonas sp. SURF-2]|uniref:YfiR family protein n=1 Tax=Methylomonas subterranea TaxID=2952225 RepID=A0ABT1TKK8_9GAMM|nr:YfiR family protein [Methylomonas sp. SURF-2]MCQ8106011.1 YfiR family protein [Methylomonas sp. SURF-2]
MNCAAAPSPTRQCEDSAVEQSACRAHGKTAPDFKQWCLIALLAIPLSSHAHAESAGEAAVKTAFLYNFFKFIDWPEAIAGQDAFSLCTTENDNLGDSLTILQAKTIANKPMRIRREVNINDLKNCHLVFIGASKHASAVIQKLRGLPVVTVGDQPDFIDQGGTISLMQSDNRLNFEINLAAANTNGVHIGAQLLKLAKRVISE